jgi:hypothetical protein
MSETDRRLKDHLNSNQAKRERMCLEILASQPGYSDLRPRLPKGGPDGARDIECQFEGELCYGAVGFVNDATDTDEHRKKAKKKFKDDIAGALAERKDGSPVPSSFVFCTNVGLTPSIVEALKKHAYKKGAKNCDIFDRERLRVALDSNRGYAVRLRYLDIALSDAEQKDFFTAWGDEINDAIGLKFRGLDKTTKRIQFLLEAGLPLDQLGTRIRLSAPIWEVCRGNFFFQTTVSLRAHAEGLLGLVYGGGTDQINETLEEWIARGTRHTTNSQYGFGFSWIIPGTPFHERFVEGVSGLERPENTKDESAKEEIRTYKSSSVLPVDQKQFYFGMLSEPFIERFNPTCKLLELDGGMVIFESSREFAENIEEITIFGNGYELLSIAKDELEITDGSFDRLRLPAEAHLNPDDLSWVTIRPKKLASCFTIDLMGTTPRRYDWQ